MNRMLLIGLLLIGAAAAGADIYKCTDDQGNVAYLQTPCPVEKKAVVEPPTEEISDEVEYSLAPADGNRSFEEIEACKEPYRDEIDEIDAEMRVAYSPEQLEEYKKRLRTLTQQMRACG